MIRTLLRALRAMPAALEREHLRWALREIDPMHPDVTYIMTRLAQLQGAR
jgi:hypothetical protein